MDVEPGGIPGSGMESDLQPNLDAFLLARIAEDKRIAAEAAAASGTGDWGAERLSGQLLPEPAAEHAARHDPDRVLAECAAKRRLVLSCRDVRPDMAFLGTRAQGLADFPLAPHDPHQLAAVTLALLALPYAGHHDYRPEWRP